MGALFLYCRADFYFCFGVKVVVEKVFKISVYFAKKIGIGSLLSEGKSKICSCNIVMLVMCRYPSSKMCRFVVSLYI